MNEFKFLVLTWVKGGVIRDKKNIGSTWDDMRRNV